MSTIVETKHYLTFKLGAENYAFDVTRVKEVLELVPITNVPKTPDFMLGVINLRGSVVPVIDLRLKFGMPSAEATIDTCIIVLELQIDDDDEQLILGAVADSVQEVLALSPEMIEPAPRIGTQLDTSFLDGMGKYNDQFLIILNIDKIFTAEDISLISNDFVQSEKEEQNG